jgi:hypothetical protein
MNLKLVSSLAGDRFSFRPGQVIKCSDATGQRLIDGGHAKPAAAGAEIEGELHDEPAEEKLSQDRRRAPEQAVMPQAETPEKGAAADRICAGSTKQGNPCKREAEPGSKFCDKHQDQAS